MNIYSGQSEFNNIGTRFNPILGQPRSRDTEYAAWSGTSMASPHVAAAVALLFANKGKMDAVATQKILMETADNVAGMGGQNWNNAYGAGRLNLLNLLKLL